MAKLKPGCIASAVSKRRAIELARIRETEELTKSYQPEIEALRKRTPQPLRKLLDHESVLENLYIKGVAELRVGSTRTYKINKEILQQNIKELKKVWRGFVEITHSDDYLSLVFSAKKL